MGHHVSVAQLVEFQPSKLAVASSSLVTHSISLSEMVEIATFCRTDTWICVKLAHEVTEIKHADVMELVDMRDLGSRA